MGKTKLDETYILKPALKCDSFDVAIGIKIPFLRVLVTIEPGRSLLQFVTTNCLISCQTRWIKTKVANYHIHIILVKMALFLLFLRYLILLLNSIQQTKIIYGRFNDTNYVSDIALQAIKLYIFKSNFDFIF